MAAVTRYELSFSAMLLSRLVARRAPVEVFGVDCVEEEVEGVERLARQPKVRCVAGFGEVADRGFAAQGAEEAIEPEGFEGPEVETVPWLGGEVSGRRLQPVGVLWVLVSQLGEPAIYVLCALPL
jgi:hypothetical protein